MPPTWVIRHPPGQHLDTLEGEPEGEWRAEPDITPRELFRRLTQIAQGTSQARSYHSQEMYFEMMQTFKETIKGYEDRQGIQYNENERCFHGSGTCGTGHVDLRTFTKEATRSRRDTPPDVSPRG